MLQNRSADRRRRVMYQSHVAPPAPSTPATRRAAEELRAARQPANSFGSRVHRQLRGRWFSLVPVSRLAILVAAALMLAIPISLTVFHHLAVTWPSLAYREGITRPFRMERPDSFAAWWTTMVLVLAAGAMRLVFVLRRHRRDDYRGHYQLWQLTLIVLLVASVHLTVGLVAWLGAFVDLAIGDRAILSGANWLRIALDIGGVILAMRLVAEVYHCRPALIAILSAAAFLGFSEAAAWQLIAVDTMTRSTLVLAAPMLGSSCLLVAATIYLRALYREVRNIADAPTVRERIAEWMAERRESDDDQAFELPESKPPALARNQPRRPAVATETEPKRPIPKPTPVPVATKKQPVAESAEQNEPSVKKPGLFSRFKRKPDETELANKTEQAQKTADEKPKRRWLGFRSAKPTAEKAASKSSAKPSDKPESTAKKSRFSMRLKPQNSETSATESTAENPKSASQDEDKPTKEKKGWLSGLLGGKKSRDDETSADDAPDSKSRQSKSSGPLAARSVSQKPAPRNSGPLSSAARNQPVSDSGQADADDEDIDFDNLDWDAMSKAEKRRMRKKLKRSGRAA